MSGYVFIVISIINRLKYQCSQDVTYHLLFLSFNFLLEIYRKIIHTLYVYNKDKVRLVYGVFSLLFSNNTFSANGSHFTFLKRRYSGTPFATFLWEFPGSQTSDPVSESPAKYLKK